MGDSGSDGRAVRDIVVGRRAISLRRAVLGLDRSPRAARVREETRNPNDSARRRIARFVWHDAAICFVRLAHNAHNGGLQSADSIHQQSNHKGNDAFDALLIRPVLLGKLLQHQLFFVAKFNPETRKH